MSSDRAQEAYPLMNKPRPTAPADPGFLPPPYSSLFGTQSQAYTPVPPPIQPPYPTESTSAQAQMPMPMPMPMPQATAPYPIADGKVMPMPVYAPTTYDPTSSEQPVSPVQTSSDDRESEKASCMPLKIIAVILIILISGFGLAMRRKDKQRQREIEETRRFDNEVYRDYSRWPRQHYNDRYKRMVHEEQPHLRDYGFQDFNDHRSFGKSIKPEKLQRKQSSFKTKDAFRKNKNGRSYQKKGNRKGKCYHR